MFRCGLLGAQDQVWGNPEVDEHEPVQHVTENVVQGLNTAGALVSPNGISRYL